MRLDTDWATDWLLTAYSLLPRAHHAPTMCPPRAHHAPTTCPPRAHCTLIWQESDFEFLLGNEDDGLPPPERVTFSLPVVNAAREKIFVAMGSGKAEMTAKILKDAPRDGSVPAALVKGNVRWIVDDDAAALLSE